MMLFAPYFIPLLRCHHGSSPTQARPHQLLAVRKNNREACSRTLRSLKNYYSLTHYVTLYASKNEESFARNDRDGANHIRGDKADKLVLFLLVQPMCGHELATTCVRGSSIISRSLSLACFVVVSVCFCLLILMFWCVQPHHHHVVLQVSVSLVDFCLQFSRSSSRPNNKPQQHLSPRSPTTHR